MWPWSTLQSNMNIVIARLREVTCLRWPSKSNHGTNPRFCLRQRGLGRSRGLAGSRLSSSGSAARCRGWCCRWCWRVKAEWKSVCDPEMKRWSGNKYPASVFRGTQSTTWTQWEFQVLGSYESEPAASQRCHKHIWAQYWKIILGGGCFSPSFFTLAVSLIKSPTSRADSLSPGESHGE